MKTALVGLGLLGANVVLSIIAPFVRSDAIYWTMCAFAPLGVGIGLIGLYRVSSA